jgi:hypothetical protein
MSKTAVRGDVLIVRLMALPALNLALDMASRWKSENPKTFAGHIFPEVEELMALSHSQYFEDSLESELGFVLRAPLEEIFTEDIISNHLFSKPLWPLYQWFYLPNKTRNKIYESVHFCKVEGNKCDRQMLSSIGLINPVGNMLVPYVVGHTHGVMTKFQRQQEQIRTQYQRLVAN